VGQRCQLALGLTAGPVSLRPRLGHDVLGLPLRGVEELPGAALGLVAEPLRFQPQLVGLLGGLREVELGPPLA
jgi:hypothetical protein